MGVEHCASIVNNHNNHTTYRTLSNGTSRGACTACQSAAMNCWNMGGTRVEGVVLLFSTGAGAGRWVSCNADAGQWNSALVKPVRPERFSQAVYMFPDRTSKSSLTGNYELQALILTDS